MTPAPEVPACNRARTTQMSAAAFPIERTSTFKDRQGEVREVCPHSMGAGGEAIANWIDGRLVSIAGGLPGEWLRVELVAKRQMVLRARLIEVVRPAPYRTTAPCPEVAHGCGGCQWQHILLPAQRLLKREMIQDVLRRVAHVDALCVQPLIELLAENYRTTVRTAVVEGRAGYRRYKGHDVVNVKGCAVAHPLVEDLLIRGTFGSAAEVILRCGARTGERLAAPEPTETDIRVPPDVRTNHLHEIVADRTWRISAHSFFQSRPDGAEALADLVGSAAEEWGVGLAIDLYSGVGLFAGVLADRGWSVVSVEGSHAAVDDARHNLRRDPVNILNADVKSWSPATADLVVANPSRRGLGRAGVAAVVATHASRIILVNCDVGAFGRDISALRHSGYELTAVKPVDMFPHTFHVEIVSILDR